MEKEEIKNNVNAEKLKVLNSTLEKLEKTFGKGSIMRMGETHIEEMDVISTGSIGLDTALGVGGFPKGRIVEIYGPESSGKTTLLFHPRYFTDSASGRSQWTISRIGSIPYFFSSRITSR